MISLNVINGADSILNYYRAKTSLNFPNEDLVGVEMGIAFGGGVETLGVLWKGRGNVYGYDTFEDLHPKHLAEDKFATEATCMDRWYSNALFGTKALSYNFQRKTLDDENLTNVHLIKGLVNKDSCKNLKKIHYAFMDMDILASMKAGYDAIKDKIVKGGYLFMHDVTPKGHLTDIFNWCEKDVIPDKRWKPLGEWPSQFLLGLERV